MLINLNDFVKELYKQNNIKDIEIKIGIEHFLNYQKANKRDGTYRYYKEIFKTINEYLNSNNINYFSQLNNEILINFSNFLQSKNNKAITINKKIGAIKTLVLYLEDLEMINHIDFKIKKLKETKPKIKIIKPDTIKLVLEHLKENHTKQHLLIFELMLETGIRRTELINIKRKNIDFNENSIFLERTKNGSPRYIYFDNNVKELIKHEINHKPMNIYLFITQQGKQLTYSCINSLFYRIKKELNIETLSAHILRHTYATAIMEQTHDIEHTRILLGHSTYEMTKRYLHLTEKTTKDISLNFNPLNKIKTRIQE